MTTDLQWPTFTGPDDLAAIEAVPLEDRDLPSSTWEVVTRAREAWPDRPAVSLLTSGADYDTPTTWTFEQLADRVTRTANALARLGVGRTDAVTLLSTNTGLLLAATFAAQAVGVAAPVNPTLAADKVAALVRVAGSKVIVAAGPELDPQIWDDACRLAEETEVVALLALRPDGARGDAPHLPTLDGVEVAHLEDLLADVPGDELAVAPPSRDDIASYFHTGGTTGMPKVATHLHSNEVVMAWSLGAALSLPAPSTFLAGLPLFHVNALLVTGLTPLLRGHHAVWSGPLGFRDKSLYANLWQIIERFDVASMSAVPTVYGVLADIPVDADISSLQVPIVGAAPLPPAVRRAWRDRTGVELCEGYGLTEGTCASAFCPPGAHRAGALGLRLPYQDVRAARLRDDGTFDLLPPGEVGVITIAGPTVFPGYLTVDEGGTRGIDPRGSVRDGRLDTGDLGTVTADGFVTLTGRAKDLIIRGGHNIDPATIEDAMRAHPAVTDAAAVGRPDAHAGEVPIVYVTIDRDVDTDVLRQWAADSVPERAAVPRDVIVVDEIPTTAVGKTFKPALRERAVATLLHDLLGDRGLSVPDGALAATHEAGSLVVDVDTGVTDVIAAVEAIAADHGIRVRRPATR